MLFVLYRQPKLAAVALLGWLLVALFVWQHVWRRGPLGKDGATLGTRDLVSLGKRPGALWLLAFLVYMAATGFWVRVVSNYRYELRQYVLLAVLTVCLYLWLQRDPRARLVLRYSLMLSLAVVSAVGLLQAMLPIPILSPINPQIGAVNPSFMGYKNPMALALLGQLFLVARQVKEGPKRWFWGSILALELIYLATLGSRTSYFALMVAGLYLAVVMWGGGRESPRPSLEPRVWLGALGLVAVFCGVLALHPIARQKATSVLSFVAAPSSYLQSDRGIYLRNTLNMASHRPWGVGLGDWQTHYPVYRMHGRDVAFDDRFQVRRAHADHVQFLGEGGWPGAILWAGFVISLLIGAHRRAWGGSAEGTHSASPFFAAQWVALFVAMGSDYLLELPYNKFQFFLILALFWSADASDYQASSGQRMSKDVAVGRKTLLRASLMAAVLVAMVSGLFHYSQLLRRSYAAASIGQAHARWAAGDATAWPAVLRQTALHESTLVLMAGDTKTLHKDFLSLAHIAMVAGRREEAISYGDLSLRHHPFYSSAFKLMKELATTSSEERAWQEGYDFLMHRAASGWQGEYPSLPR